MANFLSSLQLSKSKPINGQIDMSITFDNDECPIETAYDNREEDE